MEGGDNATSLRIASFSCYLSNPDESFVKKLGGDYEDQSYPAIFSPPDTPFRGSKTLTSQDKLTNLRVDSFSSYLKTDQDDNFAFKNTRPVQDPAIAFVFPQQPSKDQEKTKSSDGELSIFGADKYFNMKLDCAAVPTTTAVVKYAGQMNRTTVDLPHVKPNVRTKTPSVCSEASSFNSQSALLENLERTRHRTRQKKTTGRRFFASFGCQGPCLNKKAVYVDERLELGKTEKLRGVKNHDLIIEEQRKSIEVFGSDPKMRKGDISVNLERNLSMLTWDAIPKSQNQNPTTTIGVGSTVIDDMASDASSDLFEIENISSTCTGYSLMNSQQDTDYVPGCTSPTTQYAPSEASIEWSVITASAAEYSSVISDYDAKNMNISRTKNIKTKNQIIKESPKTRQGGILSCKNQKAVSVVETVNKTGEKTKHHQRS